MRLLPLLVLASACTSTSPGELRSVTEARNACNDIPSDGHWACTTDITLDGTTVTAIGIHTGGDPNGPAAAGVISDAALADLDALIAKVPLDTPDTIQQQGCGGLPLSVTHMRIDFAEGGVRDYAYVSSGDGPVLALHDYVANIVQDVTTCRDAGRIAFAHCTPYVPLE